MAPSSTCRPSKPWARNSTAAQTSIRLGVVVYEMLSGEAPFSATTPYQVLRELIHKPPPPLAPLNSSVNMRMEQAVFRALAKEPAARFGTAGEFATALASATGLAVGRRRRGESAETESRRREIVLYLTTSDGRQYPVYRGQVTIGRGTDNDIVLPVSQVSRQHASIQCDREGVASWTAAAPTALLLTAFRLPAETPWPLQPGDRPGHRAGQSAGGTACLSYRGCWDRDAGQTETDHALNPAMPIPPDGAGLTSLDESPLGGVDEFRDCHVDRHRSCPAPQRGLRGLSSPPGPAPNGQQRWPSTWWPMVWGATRLERLPATRRSSW